MTSELEELIHLLSRFPGLGPRSGRRVALHLIKKKDQVMEPLIASLVKVKETLIECQSCGNLDLSSPCHICNNPKRDQETLCVVEDIDDIWAFERTHLFQGKYHVLGGTLSAIEGRGPERLRIASLLSRLKEGHIQEVILALNATVEGQATLHYLMTQLKEIPHLKVSALARGVPLGGEIDYLDEGTLGTALMGRLPLK